MNENVRVNIRNVRYLFHTLLYLVKVKDQIQFADIAKERVQDLDKKMNRLQIVHFIVIGIHAKAEKESCIPSIHYLVIPKLQNELIKRLDIINFNPCFNKIALVLLIPGCYKTMHFGL